MSIIHVKTRNTSSHEQFEERRSADNSVLFLANAASAEAFSIELTAGSNWGRRYGPNSNAMQTIPDDGIGLRPGESVVIEVAETLRVPYNMYGLVIPTGSLFLDNGIIIAAAKIEPSFKGQLKLRLVNISGERRTITPGQKVASAIFFATDHTAFQPDKDKKIVSVSKLPGGWQRARAWFAANRLTVIGWIIVIMVSSVSSNVIDRLFPPAQIHIQSPVEPAGASGPSKKG